MAEAGYPDVEGSSWAAVVVPAGTPKEIIAQLHRRAARRQERLDALGFEPIANTSDECANFFQREMAQWSAGEDYEVA
jgi:tripartite-type tricarboxylate transporter receptor subunit TctC